MNKQIVILLTVSFMISCKNEKSKENLLDKISDINYIEYVNPFIGTSKMGHTFPGATAPFGMVQLSPQTNFEVMINEDGSYNGKTYEYCAGYQYKDTIILGFSHTNLSGTGHSDLGDFLVMPTIGEQMLKLHLEDIFL